MGSACVVQSRVYVANGSRYPIKVLYSNERHQAGETCKNGMSGNGSGGVESPRSATTKTENSPESCVVVGIGEVVSLTTKYISVVLLDKDRGGTEILRNWEVASDNQCEISVIITEEGNVRFRYKDTLGAMVREDWMWISTPDGINHRPVRTRVYIANGSRYQMRLKYTDNTRQVSKIVKSGFKFHSGNVDTPRTTTTTGRCLKTHVNVGIGEVLSVSAKYISVALLDEKKTKLLRNFEVVRDNKHDSSIIITEEKTVRFGYRPKDSADQNWMWISRPDGIDHRPRSVEANASKRETMVQRVRSSATHSRERKTTSKW